MKHLIQTVVVVFFTLSLNAQTAAPEPPRIPITYSSTQSSSFSVSKTDEDLRIKGRFHKSRFEAVKSMLIEKLGEDGLTISGNSYKWSYGADSFDCKLSQTSLKLYLDYASNNSNFISHVEDLASNLKYAISGGNPKDDVKRAQDEIRRAEDDVARAKEELERARKRLEKKKN